MFLETTSNETLKPQSSFQQKRKPTLKITDRDLDILEFLLDMKFASNEEIYGKFFPPSLRLLWGYSHWTRDRIAQLRKEGLVEPFQFPGSLKRYFLATEKGRRALIRERPFSNPPWALKKPQYIHFEHDYVVLKVRLLMEKQNLISKWISERFLKIEFGDNRENSIEKHNIPDGIYMDLAGKKVALEVEMSHKSRKKYQEKIRFMTSLMRSERMHEYGFDQVYFLCKSKAVAKTLQEETRIYGELFKVETLEEFFAKHQNTNKGQQNV